MKRVLILVLTTFLFTACNSDDISKKTGDYLIFGHYYGMCAGENCVAIFKLTDTKLYENTDDKQSLENLKFRELDEASFNQVKDLTTYMPQQLLEDDTTVFGCPDCADGGGLFIQLSKNGVVYKWTIDQVKENVPEYLHEFMDKVNEKIALINNNG
ncbi:hypothetical protein [uncultured Gelidibacter sp.]|uniref:hypothetical protein n=1 Tax=uncultured Gelidibacter sp. TaxID=259318 RepID=UPI0026266EC5|nr:hypothetical protein [uncultured Gelidibacter sp.]